MSDSFKLQIKNYQNIRDAKLEFQPGLNVIVGPSNNGKSACIRAIETAIYNIARESHVTLGETVSMVGIEYNGHRIVWRRDTTSASQVSYQIDGKVYTKVGRGQPELIADALGITELDLNGKKFRINFGKQLSYPFLLDSTPSEFFKFIVQSDDEDVTGVLDVMKKDFQDMKSNIKAYESSRDSLGQAYQKEAECFNQLRPKVEYAKKLLDIDGKVQEYKSLNDNVETFAKSIDITTNLGTVLTRQQEIYENVNRSYMSIAALNNMRKSLELEIENLSNAEEVKTSCNKLIIDYQDFYNKTNDYANVRNSLNKIQLVEAHKQSIESAISQAKHYHDIIDTETPKLKNFCSDFEVMDEVSLYCSNKLPIIRKLEEDRDKLHDEALEVFRLQKAVEDLESRVKATERIIEEYEEEFKEFPVCPHCGARLVNGKCVEEQK